MSVVLNPSGEEQAECPLCMEPLEVDDLNFYPCTCGYQICRFCWNRIREGENGLCPACRKAYPENPADFTPLSQEQVAALKTEKRAREQQRRNKSQESRRQLSSVRVVQKNLVFVVGLPVRLADPEILKRQEYFGKYGKIHKVVINHSTAYAGSQGPSASAYVTYVSSADALRAIQNVNNVTIDGRVLKGSLGTTKYCANFMRNQPCPKPDCMYLHELGDPTASFTKEEMHQGLHQMYEKKLHNQLLKSMESAAAGTNNVNINNSSPNTNTINNSSGASGPSNSGNSIIVNGNHSILNNNGPSSNSSSTSSLNSSESSNNSNSAGVGSGGFIPSAVVTSSNINIHIAKMKNNLSNGSTSGSVVLSSSSSSTSSSCSRDTWPSLGSSPPPLNPDVQDSNTALQLPSFSNQTNNNMQRNNPSDVASKQQSSIENAQLTKNGFKNVKNKENTNTTNQNGDNGKSINNNKGNVNKKGTKNKNNSEKQNKSTKKDLHSNNATSESNSEKKKSDKEKNKNSDCLNEKAFKLQVNQAQSTMDNIDLDTDDRHSLIDGHDLLEENDHTLLDDDDHHSLLTDSPPRNLNIDSKNMLKKHGYMLNVDGNHGFFGNSQMAQQQLNVPQLKEYSPLDNSNRETQSFFSMERNTLDKDLLLYRQMQQKELLLKQEVLARQHFYNAMNNDPSKFLNLDPKEQQLLLQQRLRQQQNVLMANVYPPFGVRMDGTIPQQFGLQQQMQNQARGLNGMLNDLNHLMPNNIETHGQGLTNSLSSGNIANNLNALSGLANSLSATNLSTGSKLLGATGPGNLGTAISEGRYVGEDNMDRFFLDFHRNQQLKGGRTGPLLPPEAPSLAYIESQALQRKYGLVQNGLQDTLGQQMTQKLQNMGGSIFQSNTMNKGQGGATGSGATSQQAGVINNQQQQSVGNNLPPLDNQPSANNGNSGGAQNRDDDLDFEWLTERQKLFAELIENDMMVQQGHPNYSTNEHIMQRARHPPQGFSHMNAFGIGVPRPQPVTGVNQNTMVSDWPQLDPAIVASGVCNSTPQQQQQSLIARFKNINFQPQTIDPQFNIQNCLILQPQQQHQQNLLAAHQQLQYQQQRKAAATLAAQQAAQHQQISQQQLPNSFWLLPTEQQMNNFQNRNGFYAPGTQSITNCEIPQNNKYNIPMSQPFAPSVSGNPSVNAECIESK